MVKDAPVEGEHSDLKHILRTALGVVVGIGAAAAIAYGIWTVMHEHFGFFSYTGLTQMQVAKVAHELDMRYKILIRVVGQQRPGPSLLSRCVYIQGRRNAPILQIRILPRRRGAVKPISNDL